MFMPPLYPPIVHDLYKSKWINYPKESCNTQLMFKTLTLMLTLKYSRWPIKLMVKLWKLTLSTYLVSFSKKYIFEWGWKFCSSSSSSKFHIWKIGKVFWQTGPNHEKWQRSLYAIMKHSIVNYWMCGALLWTPIQVNELLTS
jgi:hypothetical protein